MSYQVHFVSSTPVVACWTGFGWDRVNFLHCSWYGTMFWIRAEKDVFVIAEQCLHTVKAFPASHPNPPASRQGVHKKLCGDTAGTADPN